MPGRTYRHRISEVSNPPIVISGRREVEVDRSYEVVKLQKMVGRLSTFISMAANSEGQHRTAHIKAGFSNIEEIRKLAKKIGTDKEQVKLLLEQVQKAEETLNGMVR